MVWKIPATLPPHEKQERIEITLRYGWRTFLATSFIILLLGFLNLVIPRLVSRLFPLGSSRSRSKIHTLYSWTSSHWVLATMFITVVGILVCTVSELHYDLVYLSKRLGRISVALMPPMYFLTLRPAPLPNSFYLELLPLHKWISRIVVVLAASHGIFYTYCYTKTGKLFKLLHLSNLAGILAVVLFIAIGLSSLRIVRRRFYRLFYVIHIVTAWTCVPLIWYHAVPNCTDYMIGCGALLVWQVVTRIYKTDTTRMPVQYLSSTLLLVTIPKSQLSSKFQKFTPGSHVRISGRLFWPSSWLEASHPYTISSLDHEEYLQLVIRKSNYQVKLRQSYAMMGPFRSLSDNMLYAAQNQRIKRALFVVGGSGIAFAAPVFRYLKLLGVETKLLWAIRDPQDARALKPLQLHEAAMNGEVEVYFTRKLRRVMKGYESVGHYSDASEDEGNGHNHHHHHHPGLTRAGKTFLDNEEDLGLGVNDICCMEEENQPLLSHRLSRNSLRHARFMDSVMVNDVFKEYASIMYNNRPVLNLRIKSWLCGLNTGDDDCCCVDQLLNVNDADKDSSWLISAGSHKLVNDASKWASANGFTFYQEEYTL